VLLAVVSALVTQAFAGGDRRAGSLLTLEVRIVRRG
jgi:hypothetical protein